MTPFLLEVENILSFFLKQKNPTSWILNVEEGYRIWGTQQIKCLQPLPQSEAKQLGDQDFQL